MSKGRWKPRLRFPKNRPRNKSRRVLAERYRSAASSGRSARSSAPFSTQRAALVRSSEVSSESGRTAFHPKRSSAISFHKRLEKGYSGSRPPYHPHRLTQCNTVPPHRVPKRLRDVHTAAYDRPVRFTLPRDRAYCSRNLTTLGLSVCISVHLWLKLLAYFLAAEFSPAHFWRLTALFLWLARITEATLVEFDRARMAGSSPAMTIGARP